MCHKIRTDQQTTTPFIGAYIKGNEPEPFLMWVYLAPCECGKNVWGRLKDGGSWVQIEEMME